MDRTFNPYSAPQTGSEPPRAGPVRTHEYEDQQGKVAVIRIALLAFAATLVLSVVSDLMALSFLEDAKAGRATEADGEANDQRELIVVALWWLAYLASAVAIASFLYRANKNARALAGVVLEYTPGWTVAWFFMPVLNLWKPYRAVQEMFAVSQPRATGTLAVWWGSWIGMNIMGRVSARFSNDANDIREFVRAYQVDMVHSTVALVATALVWEVVSSLHRAQRAHHESGGSATPA